MQSVEIQRPQAHRPGAGEEVDVHILSGNVEMLEG